jgi:hypothetical protein
MWARCMGGRRSKLRPPLRLQGLRLRLLGGQRGRALRPHRLRLPQRLQGWAPRAGACTPAALLALPAPQPCSHASPARRTSTRLAAPLCRSPQWPSPSARVHLLPWPGPRQPPHPLPRLDRAAARPPQTAAAPTGRPPQTASRAAWRSCAATRCAARAP